MSEVKPFFIFKAGFSHQIEPSVYGYYSDLEVALARIGGEPGETYYVDMREAAVKDIVLKDNLYISKKKSGCYVRVIEVNKP